MYTCSCHHGDYLEGHFSAGYFSVDKFFSASNIPGLFFLMRQLSSGGSFPVGNIPCTDILSYMPI